MSDLSERVAELEAKVASLEKLAKLHQDLIYNTHDRLKTQDTINRGWLEILAFQDIFGLLMAVNMARSYSEYPPLEIIKGVAPEDFPTLFEKFRETLISLSKNPSDDNEAPRD